MKKRPPPEGSVFLVPLKDEGHAVGVLARTNGKGQCYGYFFGPRLPTTRTVSLDVLMPENAVLEGKFGDLGLLRETWKVIGSIPNWDKSRWPMPPMARIDQGSSRAWLSTYDDDFNCVEEREIPVDEARMYPCDALMGSGAMEARLTKMLA